MAYFKSLAFIFVLLCITQINCGLIKRDDRNCARNEPCGWAVYNTSSRTVMYYMKNTCDCPSNLKCVRAFDDVSIWSYTYQCKPPT